MNKTAVILLAAGASKRLGKPKQLLKYKDEFLINYTLNELSLCDNSEVFVVLGAQAHLISEKLNVPKENQLFYLNWKQGMGSSLAFALKRIKQLSKYKRVLITLCDLPLITSDHYNELLEMHQKEGKEIVVTSYLQGTIGVPAIFENKYFDQLSKLVGDEGAKSIIKNNKHDCIVYNCKIPFLDIDTIEDYNELLKKHDVDVDNDELC